MENEQEFARRAMIQGEQEKHNSWKSGNEYLPFHPMASHVTPEYRAGWNDAYAASKARVLNQERVAQPVAPAIQAQEPVAYATGYYAGRCVIEPINRAMVMPQNMALYAVPQPVQPECCHDETERLGAIWTCCTQCGKKWADDEVPAIAQPVAPADLIPPNSTELNVKPAFTFIDGQAQEPTQRYQWLRDHTAEEITRIGVSAFAQTLNEAGQLPATPPTVRLTPAPGYCKNCKDYTIEEPLFAQPPRKKP